MLQRESGATALDDGLDYLIEAFPDEDGTFDLTGYSSGRICIFLGLRPPGTSLPAKQQVDGVLRRMAAPVLAGRRSFPMALSAGDGAVLRQLAAVLAEVVLDGVPRSFPLLEEGSGKAGENEVCPSQGFCDLALGRWDRWIGAGTAAPEVSPTLLPEPEPIPDPVACLEDATEEGTAWPASTTVSIRGAGSIAPRQSKLLAALWPGWARRDPPGELRPAAVA